MVVSIPGCFHVFLHKAAIACFMWPFVNVSSMRFILSSLSLGKNRASLTALAILYIHSVATKTYRTVDVFNKCQFIERYQLCLTKIMFIIYGKDVNVGINV